MNITIDLPPDLEGELATEASQLKLPLPKTGAELVAYWESVEVIDSRPDIADSQEYTHQLRHEAENREWA